MDVIPGCYGLLQAVMLQVERLLTGMCEIGRPLKFIGTDAVAQLVEQWYINSEVRSVIPFQSVFLVHLEIEITIIYPVSFSRVFVSFLLFQSKLK